jgi:hypothetical protein
VANAEKLKIYGHIYYIENKEKLDKQNKERADRNKEEKRLYDIEYRKNNEDKIRKDKNEYAKNRRNTDPIFKCKSYVSRQISSMLNKLGSSKDGYSCWGRLPYEPKDLMDHLEKQFSDPENLTPDGKVWMTRLNRGRYNKKTWDEQDPTTWRWHIDHIEPHSSFPYDSMDHPNFQKAWALSNLRPLRADKNIEKGAKSIKI